jgi:hypothetical protein
MFIAQTNTCKAQEAKPTAKYNMNPEQIMQAPAIYSQCVPDMPQQASLCTSDTAPSFIRSAGTTPNYIHASSTHTTTTNQLNYPHIPSSNNKQRTNPNSRLLRSSRKHQQRNSKKLEEEARKEQIRNHRSINTQKKNKPQGTNNSSTKIITTNNYEPLRHAEAESNA